jgi:hypothetical protein
MSEAKYLGRISQMCKTRTAYTIYIGKTCWKMSLGRPRRWEIALICILKKYVSRKADEWK